VVVKPMANLYQNIQGEYKVVSNNTLSPVNFLPFSLQIKQSRTIGRLPYLCAIVIGTYKPVFISTLYEPRTPTGIWNIEYQKKRFEAFKTSDDTITIKLYGREKP
jgi:hypothetical protein